MTYSLLTTGRFTPSLLDSSIVPRVPPQNPRPPVIYLHGGGANASEALGTVVPSVHAVLVALARSGYNVVSTTAPAMWGNPTHQSRIEDAIDYARSDLGSSPAPAVVIGSSMGGASGLLRAVQNLSDTACVVAFIPAVDVSAIRAANTLGLRQSIDDAWSVIYPAPLPAGANPASLAGSYGGLPMQLWYSTDDLVSVNIAAFASATGADLRAVGPLGHTDAAIKAANIITIVNFVNQHSL